MTGLDRRSVTIQTPFSSSESDDNNSFLLVHSFLAKKNSVGAFFFNGALLGGFRPAVGDCWEGFDDWLPRYSPVLLTLS